MAHEYVERRKDGLFLVDTRVSLGSVVYGFLRGESPEGIADSFPALRLDQVFGALAFYIANREAVDQNLREERAEFESLRLESRRRNPALYAKLDEARKSVHLQRS